MNEQEMAFHALITAFTTAPVLLLLDHSKPFRLITDASEYALGAILEQADKLNRFHPVAYYSKSLNPAERNYIIHDKELLAIVTALMHFRHYLEGTPSTTDIWMDHHNLHYFMTKQKLSRRQAQWGLLLSRFDFTITHHPGTHNKSDALSRRLDHKEGMEHDNEDRVLLDQKFFAIRATRPGAVVSAGDRDLHQRLKDTQHHDQEVTQALSSILRNGPCTIAKGLEDWNLEEGLVLHKGKIYVPKVTELRHDILKLHHNARATGHPGQWKTYELVNQNYWWPGMSTFVKNCVEGCAMCQETKKLPKTIIPVTGT
jgi:RNase H-like domain found in reverse transcriptase/Integrase zinc binding domain